MICRLTIRRKIMSEVCSCLFWEEGFEKNFELSGTCPLMISLASSQVPFLLSSKVEVKSKMNQ